jgi:hypothetical protein
MTAVDHRARAEDVRWFVETGECLTGAARRLGITPQGLDKWCRRMAMLPELDTLRCREPYDWNDQVGREGRAKGGRIRAERRWGVAS